MFCKIIDFYMCMFIFNFIRFKIKVQVEDNSDDVPLILFHPLVDGIIEKVDVEEVIFPVDLNKLTGKMFAFKIEITNYNLTNFDEMYFVTNMTDDEVIINELKEKMKITEVNDKEFIKKEIHIPSVKDDDSNTSSDSTKILKRRLGDMYKSSSSSSFNDLEKVHKKYSYFIFL
ncbi:hypothetical protein Hanom_Chr07g00641061 [Helianthus anomalus]